MAFARALVEKSTRDVGKAAREIEDAQAGVALARRLQKVEHGLSRSKGAVERLEILQVVAQFVRVGGRQIHQLGNGGVEMAFHS